MEGINRTFDILESFLSYDYELSISELAQLSGLSPSVTHRIVTALVEKGYLTQKEKRGKYSLGLKFLNFSYFLQRNIAISNSALPFLLELNKEADEVVTLGICDGNELLVIERLDVSHDLRASGAVGKRAALHSSSIGKLFISQMSVMEKQHFFNSPSIVEFTKKTITELSEMEKELELFKVEGCTFDREEMAIGIWSVAAPIYGMKGKIEAGVAVIAPTARINAKREAKLTSLTKRCAANISRTLGYKDNKVNY